MLVFQLGLLIQLCSVRMLVLLKSCSKQTNGAKIFKLSNSEFASHSRFVKMSVESQMDYFHGAVLHALINWTSDFVLVAWRGVCGSKDLHQLFGWLWFEQIFRFQSYGFIIVSVLINNTSPSNWILNKNFIRIFNIYQNFVIFSLFCKSHAVIK